MSRVLISMTTIPERVEFLDETLNSIHAQTRRPDGIYIYSTEEVGEKLYNGYFDRVPRSFVSVQQHNFEDRGPVTKLAILEEGWLRDDDLIITIDDDIVYEPTWLETLVEGANKYPDEAVGFCGWNAYDFIRAAKENDPSRGDYAWPNNPGLCDVIEGWSGVAYRRKFFYIDPVMGFASVLHPLPTFKYVDDVWISWHLHRRGIGRRLIGRRLSQERPNALPGLHHRSDFIELNRQAAIFAFGGFGNE